MGPVSYTHLDVYKRQGLPTGHFGQHRRQRNHDAIFRVLRNRAQGRPELHRINIELRQGGYAEEIGIGP